MFISGLSILAPAQVQNLGSPFITNYETDQFKAQEQNWSVAQDRRGIMYFGNNSGILEFDGHHWQLLPVPGQVTVRSLLCGPDGRVYYGSVGDFGFLSASPTGKAIIVSLKEQIPAEARDFNDVFQILSAQDGIYFLSRTRIFRLDQGVVHTVEGGLASSHPCVVDGTVFYIDAARGLSLLQGDRSIPLSGTERIVNGMRIALASLGHHQLLVGRASGGFLTVDLQAIWKEQTHRYEGEPSLPKEAVQPLSTEVDAFLRQDNGSLYKLDPLDDQRFIISSWRGGIVIINRAGKLLQVINKNRGLLDNTVSSVFVDAEADLWVCSDSGISHVELSVPQTSFGPRDGLDAASICTTWWEGRLLVGTIRSLAILEPYHFRVQDDRQRFRVAQQGPRDGWQFLPADKELLVASGGLQSIGLDGNIRSRAGKSSPYCLTGSRRWPGWVFLGIEGGLEMYRKRGRWELQGRLSGVTETIFSLTQDDRGDLWAGTETKGLLRIHFTGKTPMEAVLQRFGPDQGLPDWTSLRPIIRDHTLFVATSQGLYRAELSPSSESLHFSPDLNLGKAFRNPPTPIFDMAFDSNGRAYFTTEQGIFMAEPAPDGQFQVDARPFRGIPTLAGGLLYVHPDGSLWFPGKHLYRIDPTIHKDYDRSFQTLVRRVVTRTHRPLFEGTPSPATQPSPGPTDQASPGIPSLPFKENGLFFDFSASFYEKPGTTQFQCFMEGLDKDWTEWTPEAHKEYTYLPAGDYRFRVRGRNLYGVLGQEASYAFRVLPPWYRTAWAFGLWILLLGGGLLGAAHGYTLLLRRQKQALKRIVAHRTQTVQGQAQRIQEANKDLEAANFKLQEMDAAKKNLTAMLVHDLRSPLSAIAMALDLYELKGSIEPTQIQKIRHGISNMITMLNDLLEVFRSEVSEMQVELVLLPVEKIIQTIKETQQDQFSRAGVNLEVEVQEGLPLIQGDWNKIERAISNLVGNALKYTPRGGTITISAQVLEGGGVEEGLQFVTVKVKDTGQGIPPDELPYIFEPYRQVARKGANLGVGLGLAIVHRIMAAHRGRVNVRSQVGVGTHFMLFFPLPDK